MGEDFGIRILALPALLFAIVIHEFSHAYAAWLAGDDTAALQGRLTLNPLPHMDPIGTVLIPLIQFFGPAGLPLIGWARPVPVNPLRFKSSEWDIFVSLAGPGSNFAVMFLTAIVFKILVVANVANPYGALAALGVSGVGEIDLVATILVFLFMINLVLGVFNLIPIPPLDGSHVLYHFLSSSNPSLAEKYDAIRPYGFFILILIIMSPAGRVLGWVVYQGVDLLFKFLTWGMV